MNSDLSIVVCGSYIPDPLQSLEPVFGQSPSLKNENMLPVVLDPWAAHALYEAANIAKSIQNAKVFLVSLGSKMKLQQLMMNIAQKVPFELIAVDGSPSGFIDSYQVAEVLADAIKSNQKISLDNILLFGGMASASRDSGTTIAYLAEMLGINEFFFGVDEFNFKADGSFVVKERLESGAYLLSECRAKAVAVAWATGNLPEPMNNPQLGMQNMRFIMPALQKATKFEQKSNAAEFVSVELPKMQRETRVVKDLSPVEIAKELAEWIKA